MPGLEVPTSELTGLQPSEAGSEAVPAPETERHHPLDGVTIVEDEYNDNWVHFEGCRCPVCHEAVNDVEGNRDNLFPELEGAKGCACGKSVFVVNTLEFGREACLIAASWFTFEVDDCKVLHLGVTYKDFETARDHFYLAAAWVEGEPDREEVTER